MVLELTFTSNLATPAAPVWHAVTTMRGVNAELNPVRMTVPADMRTRNVTEAPTGEWLFRSVVLLFGVLPLDVHHFRMESVGPGMRFQEASVSLVTRSWRHFRSVEPSGTGCVITDRLVIEPRVGLMGLLLKPVYRLIFWNRHRKLRRWFGESDDRTS